jgi:hypothetical protein
MCPTQAAADSPSNIQISEYPHHAVQERTPARTYLVKKNSNHLQQEHIQCSYLVEADQ